MLSARLHYCNSITEWSYEVKAKQKEGACGWIGCTRQGTGSAHMFSRTFSALRLAVENGVWLCTAHHRTLDKAPDKRKLPMIKLLVGEEVYAILHEVWVRSKFPPKRRPLPISSKDFEL